jgi:conjugative relaxase-like TrwC/TraI family protein
MLTISKMYNSLKKYEMDNYYLGENAPVYEFGGKMAERFGLKYISGGVFENVTSGKDASGAVLVRQGRAGYHNPGRDVVMSPDKSVAISCYLGRDNENRIKIMESHREAVKSVAGYIEKELILARINHGKNGIERVSTGLMLYAGFEHHTSRELDPQLHTHLVIFNITSLPAGPPARCPAKAMENRNIYDCRKLLCRIYENQLCRNLRERGFDASVSKEGYARITGIGDDLRELFSKRTVNMKEKLSEYFESKGLDPSYEIAKGGTRGLENAIMLYTRKAKKAVSLDSLIIKWREELSGIGKTEKDIPAAAARSLTRSNDGISPGTYIDLAIQALSMERGFFSKKDILSRSLSISGARADINSLEKAFDENRGLIVIDKQARMGCGYHTAYTTHEIIEIEKSNIRHFRDLQENRLELLPNYRPASFHNYMLQTLTRSYREKGYYILVISPDGKIARRLEGAMNIEVLSPERFLARDEAGKGEKTLYITDRADLIGPVKISRILGKMDSPGSKIIFTGEIKRHGREAGRDFRNFCTVSNQFEGAGAFKNEQKHMKVSGEELSRLREESLKKAENGFNSLSSGGALFFSKETGLILDKIRTDFLRNPRSSLVMVRSWREKNELNRFIRSGLENAGAVSNAASIMVRSADIFNGQVCLKRDSSNYEAGQKITALSNVRGMKKGETGTITGIDREGQAVKIAVDSSKRIAIINPARDYKKYTVGEERTANFGPGDRIVFLKSGDSGVKRGETALIEKVENGRIMAMAENRETVIDYKKFNYFDHAYAAAGPLPFSARGKNILLDLRASHEKRASFGPELEFQLGSLRPGTRIYTDNTGLVKKKMACLELERAVFSHEHGIGTGIKYEKRTSKYMEMGIGM